MQVSVRFVASLKVLIAALLMMVPIIAHVTPASAQADTYTSELSGDELSWSDDWTPSDTSPAVSDGIESFTLNGNAGVVLVNWIEGSGVDVEVAESIASLTLDETEFELIDSGVTDDGAAYALGFNPTDDFDFGILTYAVEVDGAVRAETFATDLATIDIALPVAQESVSVNGDPSFAGIESVTDESVEPGEANGGGSGVDGDEPTEESDPTEESTTGGTADNSATIALNGSEVAWTDDWELEESLVQADTDFESIGFINGPWIQNLIFLPSGIDLDGARDSFLEGFAGNDVAIQVVDRGAYDNVSYSLDLAQIDDTLFGLFTVYIDDGEFVRSYATLALESELGDGVDFAAQTITIDGEPIYNGVEGSGLQSLIDTAAENFTPTDTVEVEDDATEEATEEATAEDDDPTEEATADNDEPTEEATEEDDESTEEATEDDESSSDDLEALGLIGSREYESPQWGTSIEWTGDFDLTESEDSPGVSSDEDGGLDTLSLTWGDADDAAASISLTVGEGDGTTPAEYEELYTSDDFAGLFTGENGSIVESDSDRTTAGVLLETETGLFFYFGVLVLDDGDTVVTYLAIFDGAIGADFQAAIQDGVTVDGETIMDSFDVD